MTIMLGYPLVERWNRSAKVNVKSFVLALARKSAKKYRYILLSKVLGILCLMCHFYNQLHADYAKTFKKNQDTKNGKKREKIQVHIVVKSPWYFMPYVSFLQPITR